MRGMTVLYDAKCPFCRWVRDWLFRQDQIVTLEFVAAGSVEARRRFPNLKAADTLKEVTVVGDRGEVYVGAKAWVACLWALETYRPLAERLSSPAVMPLARTMVAAVSRFRPREGTDGVAGGVYRELRGGEACDHRSA